MIHNLRVFHTYSSFVWSESFYEIVNLLHFPLGSVCFHAEKNPSYPKWFTVNHMSTLMPFTGLMCLWWEQESKYRKKVPFSGLCKSHEGQTGMAFVYSCGNCLGKLQANLHQQITEYTSRAYLQNAVLRHT